jgi:uncharacterized protein (UPF0335 family)
MIKVGGIEGDVLKQYISKIERLEQEKIEIQDHIRETYADAKSNGFDPKIMKQVIKERKIEKKELEEQETLLAMYKRALGMLPELDQE